MELLDLPVCCIVLSGLLAGCCLQRLQIKKLKRELTNAEEKMLNSDRAYLDILKENESLKGQLPANCNQASGIFTGNVSRHSKVA